MKSLIISDMHLGSPLFNSGNKIINILGNTYKEVFLLGDIIDEWEEKVEKIKYNNKELILAINQKAVDCKVTIIMGNHDPSINTMRDIFPTAIVSEKYAYMCNDTILMHGNEFDHFIRDFSIISNIIYFIHLILERFGINIRETFRDLFYSISSKRGKNYFEDLVTKVEKETYDKYKDFHKNIIMGHTHLPKIVHLPEEVAEWKNRYINTGDCIHNRSYVIYDDEEDKFYIHEF